MAIGKQVGSIGAMKATMSSGDTPFMRGLKAGEALTVRFLTEPDEWVFYTQCYNEVTQQMFPEFSATDSNSQQPGLRKSVRYLANVLDVDEGRVVPLVIPKTLAGALVARYDKYNTVKDRDYELSRVGTGRNDTRYLESPEPPGKRSLKQYKSLDLEEVLRAAYRQVFTLCPDETAEATSSPTTLEDEADKVLESEITEEEWSEEYEDDEEEIEDDDGEEEEDTTVEDEGEEEAEDDEEEEEEYEEIPILDEDELSSMKVAELRTLAEDWGLEPEGLKKAQLVETIFEAQEEWDEEA